MLQNIRKQLAAEPQVGIVYLVRRKLWIDSTPLNQAGSYGDSNVHERDHEAYWQTLLKSLENASPQALRRIARAAGATEPGASSLLTIHITRRIVRSSLT